MEYFDSDDAFLLIKTALESKAITLIGNTSTGNEAIRGQSDALYLVTLLNALEAPVVPDPGLPAKPWMVANGLTVGMNTTRGSAYGARRFANIMYDMAAWEPVVASGTARVPGASSQRQGVLMGDGDGSGTDSKFWRGKLVEVDYGAPAGTYTVFNPSGQEFALGTFSAQGRVAYTTAKYVTFSYTPGQPAPGSGLYIWCRRSMLNPAGNLQIIMPGCVGDGTVDTVNGTYKTDGTFGVTSGNPWAPDFISFHKGLNLTHTRWMSALNINGSVEVDWSDRTTMDGITFDNPLAGMPHEMIIDFSNRTGIDPWMNIPSQSTPDYWAQCAALYASKLNTNRGISPEYINEVWNFANAYNGTTNWVAYLQYTKHIATVSDASIPASPCFYSPAHGRSVGDVLALFATRENAPLGNNATFRMAQAYSYAIKADVRNDADHFVLDLGAAGITLPVGLVNIQYIWLAEPGKTIADPQPALNFMRQQQAIWVAFDAALGRSRVHHYMGSQAANSTVTAQRIVAPGAVATVDAAHIGPYYSGLYWQATFTGSGGTITPSCWAFLAGTVYYGVYTAGSTPSILDILRGMGTGFISGSNQAVAANVVTIGAAVAGLTDGTNYAAFAVFRESTTGYAWKIGTGTDAVNPANVLSTVAAGAQICYDSAFNQAARLRLFTPLSANVAAHQAAMAAAGSTAPVVTYEGGPDFNTGANIPTSLINWVTTNYFPTTLHAATFTNAYNDFARSGIKSHCHYIDIQGGGVANSTVGNEYVYDLVPNMLFSATAVDGRYAAVKVFNGVVPAQAPFPTTVTQNRVATPVLAVPGSFPATIYSDLPLGYTYQIVNGDWMGNFAVSGTNVTLVNVNEIDFSKFAPIKLTIDANDGFSSASFVLTVPLGSAWYESDARFLWDSVGAAAGTSMVTAANPPFTSFGSNLAEVTGTGNPVITSSSGTVTNDVWKMATYVFANASAMATTLSAYDASANPTPILIAHVADIGDQATLSQYELGVGQGSAFIGWGAATTSSTRWRIYNNGDLAVATNATGLSKGTKHVHWVFIDSINGQIITGLDQTTSMTTTVVIPTFAWGRDVRIGSFNSGTTSFSQMYHGSLEIVARAGLTLAQAKAIVQNMQTHHGI